MDYDKLSSLPAMFFANTKDIGNRPFLWAKHDGEWQPTSGEEARQKAIALSNSLIQLGVSKGDRIVLVSESRPEWMIADIAIWRRALSCLTRIHNKPGQRSCAHLAR